MDIGTVLLMAALSYSLGLLWYDLLPGRLPTHVWRVGAYAFLGIFVAQATLPGLLPFDPTVGGISVIGAFIGSLIAVIVDWLITQARHPALVMQPELRAA